MAADPQLLDLQAHDSAVDALTRRLNDLPEQRAVDEARARLKAAQQRLEALDLRLTEADRERAVLHDEATILGDKMSGVNRKLESGKVTSPREMQAMVADVEMLGRKRSGVEDRELECMMRLEEIGEDLREASSGVEAIERELHDLETALAGVRGAAESELAEHKAARDAISSSVDERDLQQYERIRSRSDYGIGAAALDGGLCQGCHIRLPEAELAEVRAAALPACPNCSAVLIVE